ncbi:MAG: class B sortase [Clostridia bacterium]
MKKSKKPWSLLEKWMAGALVVCLLAAGVMAALILRETKERAQAGRDQAEIEESYLFEGALPTKALQGGAGAQGKATPAPMEEAALEDESLEADTALAVVMHNEELRGGEERLASPAPTRAGMGLPAEGVPAVLPTGASSTAPCITSTPKPSDAPAPSTAPTPTSTPTEPRVGSVVMQEVRYSVDFESLRTVNKEVIGWLLQDNTEINFPVVQGKDNSYYLEHLYTGKHNRNGAIFADCGNSPYFTDMVTYLYGHNRKDGSMFATLPNYQQQAYFDAHPNLTLLTPYEDYRVEIFACIRVSLENQEDWHAKQFASKVEFDTFIQRILAQSKITAHVEPQWGDQLLALCTCTNEVHEERYLVFARMRPLVYSQQGSVALAKRELDAQKSLNKLVSIPERGQMQYYAQNDPLWAGMRYEGRASGNVRRFGAGGCGPTSMAMVVANLVDESILWWLDYYSGRDDGLRFCSCSVNQYFCNHQHVQYRLETPQEFKRYLPLVMASFATGNNQWKEISRLANGVGTRPIFMKRVAQIFGLPFAVTKQRKEAMDTLRRGGMVVGVTGGKISPFTGGGHYVTLASMDEKYLYILDPYQKEDYSRTDRSGVLEMLEPGVLRVEIEHWDELCLYTYYCFDERGV